MADTVWMQRGEEKKEAEFDPLVIAGLMTAGWRQCSPTPLQQAPVPHPEAVVPPSADANREGENK